MLGVDEHTGLVLDLDAGSAAVVGRGGVTVRRRGHSLVFPSGTTLAIAELREAADRGESLAGRRSPAGGPGHAGPASLSEGGDEQPDGDDAPPTSLLATAQALQISFDRAIAARDVEAATAAVLDLEAAIVAWSRDTLQSDEGDAARSVVRSMVVRLGELAEVGVGDPEDPLRLLVDALVDLRTKARSDRDWAGADGIRHRLQAAGVEVNDTPEGTEWRLLS
ncbi:MAG: CysS/YqeB C-terminal domain-containing protein [Acidimicrobiales bacterium]